MNAEQLLAIINDTRIELKKLKEDNERLKEAIRSTTNWQLSDPEADDIKAWELRDKLAEWAGESEETDTF